VNQKLNQFARSTASVHVSPHELFHKNKLNWDKHFRHSFGELIYTHEDSTSQNNSMLPRVIPSIALVSTGSQEGTIMCLNLNTFKIIVRNFWTPSPMTHTIIKSLMKKLRSTNQKFQNFK
jgi:hypothetical protein